jgi:hypothetical protein
VPPLRLISTLALTAVLAAVGATTTAASSASTASPTVVHRGQAVRIAVRTPSHSVCLAEVRYFDGALQESGIKSPHDGAVSWTMRVPTNATLGAARWNVRCGVVWHRSGAWRVAAAKASGATATPHVLIDKEGFSQRHDRFGTGSSVSYGFMLKDTSAHEDAENVYLLINFVSATGELLGTVTKSVALISAGQTYAFGDSMKLRTQVPVTKLEVTIKVQAHEPTKARAYPHFVNVRILPATADPGWVSEVDGEVVNDTSPQTLTRAKLSIVLLDASGQIVGGGTGITFSPLPSGSRMVFIASSGFSGVPLAEAVVPVISVEPTYQTD